MNILIATVGWISYEEPTFEQCINHYVGYSLKLKKELQRLDPKCNISLASIDYLKYDAYSAKIKNDLKNVDVILILGYSGSLAYMTDWIENARSEDVLSDTVSIFTLSTSSFYRHRLKAKAHFEMMLQSFFESFCPIYEFDSSLNLDVFRGRYSENDITEDLFVHHNLPIPRTLDSEKSETDFVNKGSVCIDGPFRGEPTEGVNMRMTPVYNKLIKTFPQNDIFQLSPSVNYYRDKGLIDFQPPLKIIEVPYMTMPKLRTFLNPIEHFVVSRTESYGGMVADCLSTRTIVHYPTQPLVNKHALRIVDAENLENCIPFSSVEQLCDNIKNAKFKESNSVPNQDVFKYISEIVLS